MKTAVVFVHGLWLTGTESLVLRHRLARDFPFECFSFTYPTMSGTLDSIADRLTRFVNELDRKRVHFVGHSLGGIVLYQYFERAAAVPEGRAVFLGSPVVKSRTAESVGALPWLAPLIGKPVAEGLIGTREPRIWKHRNELGLIAGSSPVGLGRFFARFEEPCDGTVGVSETRLPGATAHLTLPSSHMGMLVSARVAREVGEFLEHGKFSAP